MKFLVAIALFAAAASARILPADLNLTPQELAEVQEIMAAIHSPSTDPNTAVMLEQMLFDLLGVSPVKPPSNDPTTIDQHEPVHVGPALIDFPLPGGAIDATPVAPAPATPTSPLVQITVNVNKEGGSSPSPVQVDQVEGPSPVIVPTPVHVVDQVDESIVQPTPVHVVDHIVQPTPVHVVDHIVQPTPVHVVDHIVQPTPVHVVDHIEESIVNPTPVHVVDHIVQTRPRPGQPRK